MLFPARRSACALAALAMLLLVPSADAARTTQPPYSIDSAIPARAARAPV